MSAKGLEMHRLQELVRLLRSGHSERKAAKLLKMSRDTARKFRKNLEAVGLLQGAPDDLPELHVLRAVVEEHTVKAKKPAHEVSSVEKWRPQVEKMLVDRDAGPKSIFNTLQTDHPNDFKGSLSAIKRVCASILKEKGIKPSDVVIPVETLPGQIAQVDFGYLGKIYDPDIGKERKTYVFVMTLCFSRRSFACLTFDQSTLTWLQCHVAAFDHFKGVPETIVPDNLKAAVIRCAFALDKGDNGELNRSYVELARHYGFTIDPTPPRSPEDKGKVESTVKYVKNNFAKPRDLNELGIQRSKAALALWLTHVADVRIHGTTHKRPIDLFNEVEKAALKPLPQIRYEYVIWKEATVHPDTHIIFDNRQYSVPFQNIGQKVWVRATVDTVYIYANETRVADHPRRGPGNRVTNDAHLPEHRAAWRHRDKQYWQLKADVIGKDVGKLVAEIFASEDVHCVLRTVQGIVSHVSKFPPERANAAACRALHYGNLSYQGIKDILTKALDKEPLPDAANQKYGVLDKPRFARTSAEIVTPKLKQQELY